MKFTERRGGRYPHTYHKSSPRKKTYETDRNQSFQLGPRFRPFISTLPGGILPADLPRLVVVGDKLEPA